MAPRKQPLQCHQIRALCVENEWFDAGSINQYAKLFEAIESGASIHEIALIIYICTSRVRLDAIESILTNVLNE